MISSLVALALGAAGAIEADKLMERIKARLRPHGGATGMLLDKVNQQLEARRGAPPV